MPRLYLSSFRLGRHSERLVDLAGDNRRALVVVNSCDEHPSSAREEKLLGEFEALSNLGFHPEELDLRLYFHKKTPLLLERRLRESGLVWIRGGNIFVLLRAVREARLDVILPRLLAEDSFVYGGYSAGVVLLTRDAHGVELVDDPSIVPHGYPTEIVWKGVGWLPFAVAPHYRSDHPESSSVEKLVHYYIDHHVPFVALRDGEVMIQETGNHELRVLGI